MKLPFLDTTSKWPGSKDSEERVINPSYDAQIQDGLIDELLQSLEHKDVSGFRASLHSLIQSIKTEGQDDA